MGILAGTTVAEEQLPELLSAIADAPDLGAAADFLLSQLMEGIGATRGCVLAVDSDQLVQVAAAGWDERAIGGGFSIGLDQTGHPLVVSALTLRPVSCDQQYRLDDRLPFEAWVALPYAQPQRRGGPTFLPDHVSRDLGAGCNIYVPASDARRRSGRAPAGVIVLETTLGAAAIEALDRVVTLAGALLARIGGAEAHRKSAERLETRMQLLTTIIDALPDPIAITDAANDIVVQNRQAEQLLLAQEADSSGRRRAVEINNLLFTSFLARSVMTGGVQATARELNLVDPDEGTDLLFEVLARPLLDVAAGGSVGGEQFLSVLRNVTDLRRASRELEQQIQRVRLAEIHATRERDRLNLILENVADPILVTDDRSNIMLMNDQAEKLFALAEPDAEAAPISTRERRAVRGNDTKFTTFISDFTIDSVPSMRAQMELTDPRTGVKIPMEVVSGKILNERGESMAIVSVLHDLTKQSENERLYEELKRLNSELERRVIEATADLAAQNARLQWQSQEVEKANKLKSDFLASMSHELRTPINALIGYTSLMLDHVYGDLAPLQEEALQRIRASARHLLELISDILDLARIEAGKMPINLTVFAMGDVIAEVAKQIEPMVSKKGLAFECVVDPGLKPVNTDRMKVKQILLNLLSNAVKFTSSGKIVLTAEGQGERVTCHVEDSGIGIKPEDLETIWEDFRQLDGSRTREFGGTGLGLSITRRLAQQLGGRVSVRSNFGRGSTFTVTLPLRAPSQPDETITDTQMSVVG